MKEEKERTTKDVTLKKTQLGGVMLPEDFRKSLRAARDRIDLENGDEDVRYYRAYLKADRMIYAYEGDKQILLQMLRDEAEALGYEVLAFTLLDDELQLLLCRHTIPGRRPGGRGDLVKALHEDYAGYYQSKHGGGTYAVREESGWKRIQKAEILANCDEIHELPVREHYVKHAKDFWWSSQNSYYGKYIWHFLNLWRIMGTISSDPMEAIRLYRDRQTGQ